MSDIDSRIVEIKFNNSQFLEGIKSTLSGLLSLERGLKLDGASKGLDEVQKAASRFSLDGVSKAADAVAVKFGALQVIAITALTNIVNKAVTAGASLIKSLTIGPISSGLQEYETNLNAIQTIMANTGLKGSDGLGKVNDALSILNTYSDKTIYNFSEMAKNIGTFTAAGVNLDTATGAIKGIANLAALSGSNSQQASTAMYQLSQALSAGRVSLMDWNSVVNAGLGGKVFQDSLKETAKAHGVAVDEIIKKSGSFRDSLQEGWITSDVLTETLSKFTGDLSAAQLTAMGYTDQQAQGILEMGKTAQDAATKVKTMSQLIDTLRESVGSGWSKSFQLVFGDFDQARDLFTGVNNVLGAMIQTSADARNKVLGDWNAMGGRTVLIQAISNAFHAVIAVLKTVHDAFRDIFPKKTGKDLYDFTVKLRDFTEKLKIGADTADKLKRTFAGVFAVFDILKQILGGAITQVFRFFGALGGGTGSFLNITSGVGDFLVSLDQMLKQGNVISNFFERFGDIVAIPLKALRDFAKFIAHMFDSFSEGSVGVVTDALDTVGEHLSPLQTVAERIHDLFDKLGGILVTMGSKIGIAMSGVGQAIGSALAGIDFNKVLSVVRTGLFAAIVLMLKNFFSGGVNVNVGEGLFDKIKGTLDGVTGSLQAMQQNLKSDTLIKIAIALALLTASIVALSTVDGDKLVKAMASLAIGYVGLQVALVSLSNAVGVMGTLKLPLLAASIVALAAGLILMAIALKIMASIDGEDMTRSLVLLGASLLIIKSVMIPLSKDSGSLIRASVAIGILAGSLIILAIALKLFATMKWQEMAKGLTVLAASLTTIAIALKLMPSKGVVAQSAGLVILAAALIGLGLALKLFATMNLKEIGKSLLVLAGSLVIIAVAMNLMPANMALQAASLIAVAVALNLIGLALKSMGGMSWGEIAKGLITLAGALIIIAAGLYLMTGTLGGSAALLIAAGALAILVPVLALLGSLSWETILTALVALAAVFVVLGVAGLLLTPVVPVIVLLAAAMVLVGAGLALAGLGALAFAAAFATVVSVGAAGVAVLAGILSTFIAAIPEALKAFGEGIIELAKIIATGGPAFVDAFSAVLQSILTAVIINTPLIGEAFLTLVNTALHVVVTAAPAIAEAGLQLIIKMISLMAANVYKIVTVAVDLITQFLKAIGDAAPRLAQSGAETVIKFINAVAETIRNNSAALGAAGANLATAIIEGIVKGLASGVGVVATAAKNVAKSALGAATSFLGIKSPSKEFYKVGMYSTQGMANGLDAYAGDVRRSAERVGDGALTAIRDSVAGMYSAFETQTDINPTITPVLDLSQIRKQGSAIPSLIPAQSVSVDASYDSARYAMSGYNNNQQVDEKAISDSIPKSNVTYIQNNTSPKALSAAEIYRQTNNQLSRAKAAKV